MFLESKEVFNLTHLCCLAPFSDLGSVNGSQNFQETHSLDDGPVACFAVFCCRQLFFPTHADSPTQRAFTDSGGQNLLHLFSPFECTDPLFTKALLAQERSVAHAHSREKSTAIC